MSQAIRGAANLRELDLGDDVPLVGQFSLEFVEEFVGSLAILTRLSRLNLSHVPFAKAAQSIAEILQGLTCLTSIGLRGCGF